MTVALGGRAAEELVFGSDHQRRRPTTSSKVAEISRRMIHEWAMGTSVSALQLRGRGRRGVRPHARAARRRAAAPRRRGDAPRVASCSAEHRPQLDALAQALLRHEVLEREDIERDHGRRADAAALGDRGGLRVAADRRRTSGSIPERSGHGRSRPMVTGRWERLTTFSALLAARRDPRRVPADRAAVRSRDDRLRGPRALSHAARPGRAAARRDARRRARARAARRPRGRVLVGDRRRPARRPTGACCGSTCRPRRSATRGCSSSRASCRRGS